MRLLSYLPPLAAALCLVAAGLYIAASVRFYMAAPL